MAVSSDRQAGSQDVIAGSPFFISPPMTVERYAEIQGTTAETVHAQIKRGLLPTIKIGKRRLINTYRLASECLKDE